MNDIDKQLLEEHVDNHKVAASPPPPQPDMVLPSIHIVWRPLMEALKVKRIAIAEFAMGALARITEAAGSDFMGRRLKADIWPVFQTILGPNERQTRRPLGPLLEEAPNSVERLRVSALSCVKLLTSISNSWKLFRGFVRPLIDVVVPYIGKSYSGIIRESAIEVMLGLAKVDADAVWLILADICANSGDGDIKATKPKAIELSNPEKLLPPLVDSHESLSGVQTMSRLHDSYRLSKTSALDCAETARSILDKISTEEVAWHNSLLFSFKLQKS